MPAAPTPPPSSPHAHQLQAPLFVDLPGGGRMPLQTQEEVDLWNESKTRYISDYQLTQQNDLTLLGAILTQQLIMFRAQHRLAGVRPEVDQTSGLYTGRYVAAPLKPADASGAQATLIKAADQIREIEKALGIDKKTREAGGAHTVQSYVLTLKAAAREYGLHISKRLIAYERVSMDARQRLRILRNADAEDRAYHNITPETICAWLEDELLGLEKLDQEFAKTKQRLYLGKV